MIQVLPNSDIPSGIRERESYTCIDYDTFKTFTMNGVDLLTRPEILGVENGVSLAEIPLPEGKYSLEDESFVLTVTKNTAVIQVKEIEGKNKYLYFKARQTDVTQLLQEYIVAPVTGKKFVVNYCYQTSPDITKLKITMGINKYKIMIDRQLKMAVVIRDNQYKYTLELWNSSDYVFRGSFVDYVKSRKDENNVDNR